MRTTITIDDALLTEAKERAARRGVTLRAVIEDAVRESFSRAREAHDRELPTLPTFRGTGLLPGVDLDSNSALLDLMDGIDR